MGEILPDPKQKKGACNDPIKGRGKERYFRCKLSAIKA